VSFAGAIIVIGEPFKINRFVGVLMILMGILILFVKTGNHKNIQQKMLLFAIISPIGYGLGQLFDGMNSMNFSPAFYAGLGTFLPGVVLVIFAFFRKITIKDFVGELRQNWLMILLMSLANTIGYYLLIVTYEFIDKSLAIPLLNLNAAFSVILGMIILKERRNMLRKIIATLVILAAVILLARA
jgi:drug/metabolite transporter (DMT)-like permease